MQPPHGTGSLCDILFSSLTRFVYLNNGSVKAKDAIVISLADQEQPSLINILTLKTAPYQATVAELAACSPHDRKVVGSNPRWVQY